MPFLRVRFEGEPESSGNLTAYPTKPNQIPLFFIPGILGNGSEFQNIIEQLRANGDHRPFYVYYHPSIAPDKKHSYKEDATLEDQAKLIAECMLDILPKGPLPHLVVGYSYGCSQAALAARHLPDARLFLIDGPSPECSREYFTSDNPSLIIDLFNIVKYAAILSEDDGDFANSVSISSDLLDKCKKLDPLSCIDEISKYISLRVAGINQSEFNKYLKIAKQGIKNLVTPSPPASETALPEKIVTLITKETLKKYGNQYAGWDKHTERLLLVNDEHLQNENHMSLLEVDQEMKLVHSIERFVAQETRPENLLALHLNFLLQTYCKSEPNLERQSPTSISPESLSPEMQRSPKSVTPPKKSKSGFSSPSTSDIEDFNSDNSGSPRVETFSDEDENIYVGENEDKVNPLEFLANLEQIKRKLTFFMTNTDQMAILTQKKLVDEQPVTSSRMGLTPTPLSQ